MNLTILERKYLLMKILNCGGKIKGCWHWNGYIKENGYGRLTFKRKQHHVHRISYELFYININSKLEICHTCDNRSCVNPLHLFQGTRLQNVADAVKKNRIARGEKLSKRFKNKDILKILKDSREQKEIAKDYNVSPSCIGKIKRREIWAHVEVKK